MPRKKINDTRLIRLVDEGRSFAEIGKVFSVSAQAAHKRFRELRGRNTKVVVAQKVAKVVDCKIDVLGQLKQINNRALQILDEAMEGINEGQKWAETRTVALRSMSEVRAQIALQIEILKSLYSLQAAGEFMSEVLEVLREVSPELRSRVLSGLRKKRAIISAVQFD